MIRALLNIYESLKKVVRIFKAKIFTTIAKENNVYLETVSNTFPKSPYLNCFRYIKYGEKIGGYKKKITEKFIMVNCSKKQNVFFSIVN